MVTVFIFNHFRVSTCHQASLGNFLSAHKVVAKVLMSQKRADGMPFLNTANRYSGKYALKITLKLFKYLKKFVKFIENDKFLLRS